MLEAADATTVAPAARSSATAVAMVTIGRGAWTRRHSVDRARAYAARHGYDFVQVTEAIRPDSGRTPHWDKLLLPQKFPGYARYLIVDDDVLISGHAPELPEIGPGKIGIVKEPVMTQFDPPMQWLGNSGVLLVDAGATDLLERAYKMGVVKGKIPGIGEQPALNIHLWNEGRAERLDWRWNYLVMADWLSTFHHQEYCWTSNMLLARTAKVTLFAALAWSKLAQAVGLRISQPALLRLQESYFVHLVWFRVGASSIHHYLG